MAQLTPLYEEHKKLGAKIVEFGGWEMPIQYKGVREEHTTVRTHAGLFDVSHMGIFEVTGREASNFLDFLTPNDVSSLKDNQAHYSLLLNEQGTIVDDIIIYKINVSHFLIVVNAANREKDFRWIEKHIKGEARLKSLSEEMGLLALQGPRAIAILSKAITTTLDGVEKFHMTEMNRDGIGRMILARTGYTGEDGFEIFVARNKMVELWKMLLELGKPEGLEPIGLGARDTLRLEMKYSLYGNDISEETNALEAGLGWVVKLDKNSKFLGQEALAKIKREGVGRKLVGFCMKDRGIPRHGYKIVSEGKIIGEVTSGTFSPSLEEPIGVGYVAVDFSAPGSKFSVDIRGSARLAEVVKTPFYKKSVSS